MSEGKEIAVAEHPQVLTMEQVRAHLDLVQKVTQSIMKRGPDYDTVPGCGDKPALLKSGAEKLCVTFRMAPEVIVEDLSSADEARYRVRVRLIHQAAGFLMAEGIGECSSSEEKYRWKAAVNEHEFNDTPEDRRRLKWKKSRDSKDYQVKQIRTNPADVANTVLKMAKKRGLVDAVLSGTAASFMFTQDIEEMADIGAIERPAEPASAAAPAKNGDAAEHAAPAQNGDRKLISDPQRKRFYAIWKTAGKTEAQVKAYLMDTIGEDDSSKIPVDLYDSACAWAAKK